jgi:hypothetical protein
LIPQFRQLDRQHSLLVLSNGSLMTCGRPFYLVLPLVAFQLAKEA